MASRGRLILDNQPQGGASARMSHPPLTVVRVNPGRNPHAPGALPHQQDRHNEEAGRDRPTQQGVQDPVPAVTVLVRTFGFGHSRPPFLKAATVLHLACGEETPLPTMGTETMQHEPAVSVSDHPKSLDALRVIVDFNKATGPGRHTPGKMGQTNGLGTRSTLAEKCANEAFPVDNSQHFPGMTRIPARHSVVRCGRRVMTSAHIPVQAAGRHGCVRVPDPIEESSGGGPHEREEVQGY